MFKYNTTVNNKKLIKYIYIKTFFQQQVPLQLPCYDFTQVNISHLHCVVYRKGFIYNNT